MKRETSLLNSSDYHFLQVRRRTRVCHSDSAFNVHFHSQRANNRCAPCNTKGTEKEERKKKKQYYKIKTIMVGHSNGWRIVERRERERGTEKKKRQTNHRSIRSLLCVLLLCCARFSSLASLSGCTFSLVFSSSFFFF